MKKLILTAFALTAAVGVYAQGTVTFQNRVAGSVITHVYGTPAGMAQAAKIGNAATGDTPAGTMDWTGYSLLKGTSYLAALLSAPGAGDPLSTMAWADKVQPFRTEATAGGFWQGTTATLANVAKDAASATLQVFCWDNTSGNFATAGAAYLAWQAGTIAGGLSNPFTVQAIGGDANVPPNLVGLQSFNIYLVPEPTTMALAGLGAAALLIFRRRS